MRLIFFLSIRPMIWRQTPSARALTAVSLACFAGAAYYFTISRQEQETFQDIDDKGNPINSHKQY